MRRWMFLSLALFPCLSIPTGCNAAPTTAPSATVTTTRPADEVLSLSAVVPSDELEKDDWELSMQNQLTFGSETVLFGDLSIYDDSDKATDSVPVIGVRRDGKTLAMRIDDPRLKNADWSYISAGPTKNEFWGVLDAALTDKQPELVMVHSMDGGKTLHLTSLPKPIEDCAFDSFCMDRDGRGRVTVYVDRTKTRGRRAGYYHYRTTDDGKSWSAPELEHDAMTPADDATTPTDTPEPKPSRV